MLDWGSRSIAIPFVREIIEIVNTTSYVSGIKVIGLIQFLELAGFGSWAEPFLAFVEFGPWTHKHFMLSWNLGLGLLKPGGIGVLIFEA